MKTLNLHLNFLSFWHSTIEENKMPHSLHPSIPALTSVSNTAVCGCGVRGGTLVTGVRGRAVRRWSPARQQMCLAVWETQILSQYLCSD